jgi:hypothetical protein
MDGKLAVGVFEKRKQEEGRKCKNFEMEVRGKRR